MRDDASSRDRDKLRSRTSAAEDLSEASIRRELRSEALQHPATLLPFILAVLALADLLIFELIGFTSIIVLIVALVTAGISFFWIYSIRHDVEYAKKVQEIMDLMEQYGRVAGEGDLKELQDTLQSGFVSLKTSEGLKALSQLVEVYDRLQPVLESKRATDAIAVAQIPNLAEETYKQGLSVLADALGLMTAIHSPQSERLQREIVDYEKELETLRRDSSEAERVKMREGTIASNKEILALIGQQQLRVEQLLYQSEQCEASLRRTRIEIAGLKADSAESSVRDVTTALRQTINQAKEVQEELKRLGY